MSYLHRRHLLQAAGIPISLPFFASLRTSRASDAKDGLTFAPKKRMYASAIC
ncbi:MAG: hypothetical protein NTW52_00950 [Planctomycetota bacterium]|nr:hypothetical protein [Planctomycetota bacterium]